MYYNSYMELPRTFESFLAHLRRRNYSRKTVDAYLFDLGKLHDYALASDLADFERPESFRAQDINSWIDEMLASGISHVTIARRISSARTFFEYLKSERIIENNPCATIKAPKIRKKQPESLSPDEIRQIAQALTEVSTNYTRDIAMFTLLYGTGIRLSEIIALRIRDFSPEQQTVRVLGKGSKERILPLPPPAYSSLLDLLSEKEKEKDFSPRTPIFTTDDGKSLTARRIQYLLQKAGKHAGILSHVHPHLIRHSIATHLVDRGCHLEAVRKTLGHESLATTSIYLKSSSKFLRDEHARHNPSSELFKK